MLAAARAVHVEHYAATLVGAFSGMRAHPDRVRPLLCWSALVMVPSTIVLGLGGARVIFDAVSRGVVSLRIAASAIAAGLASVGLVGPAKRAGGR